MGVYSVLCKRQACGLPLLNPNVVGIVNEWMRQGTAVSAEGTITTGMYDGYGGLDGTEVAGPDETQSVWHTSCYELDGRPGYTGPSEGAPDQGYWFESGTYDLPDPLP